MKKKPKKQAEKPAGKMDAPATGPTIELWPLSRFSPYARNPRKNDHAVERMVASIREFGFKIPMLARSSGEVVDGHLRLKAAAKLELEPLPVILCDEWTEGQVKAFRLMVNRSVGWAEWDLGLLGPELLDLKALDLDLSLTGFDADELAQYMASPTEGSDAPSRSLSDRFGVPPFSVLDARQGYWQDRKRAWLSLGIQSELGRGGAPGGSPRPAAQLTASGHTQRGDGRGAPIASAAGN